VKTGTTLLLDTLEERKQNIPVTDPSIRKDYDQHLTYYAFAYAAEGRPAPEERIDNTLKDVTWDSGDCQQEITYSSQMSPDRLNRYVNAILFEQSSLSACLFRTDSRAC
jgi:hypothetical protein